MVSLAVKYRPTLLQEVCGQTSIIKILQQQIQTQQFKNAYLFCGASGIGKTTIARAFANAINNNIGTVIEIDAASNNSVDNARMLVKLAEERAIDCKYKIIIMDECHVLSNQAWQVFLKCLEQPPEYTIFMFCTTDAQKIPSTINNRCQRFNLTRLPIDIIKKRLIYICEHEHYINYNDCVNYICKISNGGMRDAIALLEKAASYSTDLCIDNTLQALGNFSYDKFFSLINNIIDGNERNVLTCITDIYNSGNDLKLFLDELFIFCLDIVKYYILKDIDCTHIPSTFIEDINAAVNFDNAYQYYMYIVDKLYQLRINIKNDSQIKSTIELALLQITRLQ